MPKARKGNTYGRSSEARRPVDDWVWLEGFPVTSPIVSWAEYEMVQQQLQHNKEWARRNARHTYILGGMLFCNEDGWRLQVDRKRPNNDHYYICPKRQRASVGIVPCTCPRLNGPQVERSVWDAVSAFLSDPKTFMAEMDKQKGVYGTGESSIRERIDALQKKLRKVDDMEAELVGLKLRGMASQVAFDRQSALLRAERSYYQEDIGRQENTLATYQQQQDAVGALEQVRAAIVERLEGASPEDRRWVLQALDTRVTVQGDRLEVSIGSGGVAKAGACVHVSEVA